MKQPVSPTIRLLRSALQGTLVPILVLGLAACGGDDNGTEPEPPVTVSVSPTTATVGAAETETLTATVQNASNTGVTWTSSGGTIAGSGSSVNWTAPVEGGAYTVTATSAEDATRSATANLTVTAVQVAISPASPALLRGEPTTLTATVSGTTASTAVTWEASCGTLTPDGSTAEFQPPPEPGVCDVTATSDLDPTKSATAEVTVRRASAVTAEDDVDDGDCTPDHCSLREAITEANLDIGADTIYLSLAAAGAASARSGGPQAVIEPTTSLPTITDDLTLIGEGPDVTVIDMMATEQDLRRAFDISGEIRPTHVTLRGLTVQGAMAAGGPAIYLRDGAVLNTVDVALRDNTAVTAEGGAMVVAGLGTMAVLENTVIDGNESTGNVFPGGGISVIGGGSLQMSGGSLTNNLTSAWGGAIRGIAAALIALDGTLIDGNRVLAGGAGGAALFVESPGGTTGIVTLTDVTVSNNESEGNYGGGALAFRSDVDVTITNSTISGNTTTAASGGGGIHLGSNVQVMMSGSTVTGNSAGLGGGLYVSDATLTLDDTEVDGNTASERGGGFFAWSTASVTIMGGSVSVNSGGTLGGAGFWAQDDAVIDLDGTVIAENLAPGNGVGGGFAVFNNTVLTANEVEIRDNTAFAGGGGVFQGSATSRFEISNSILSGNEATAASGGGIFADGLGTMTIENVTMSGNMATTLSGGALFAFGDVTIDISESSVTGNSAGAAGGGLWIRGASTLDHLIITDNVAGSNGGGLSIGGNATMTNSTLANNEAGNQGGGIFYVPTTPTPFRVHNSTVSGNRADFGGGVAALADGEMIHTTVTGNEATTEGGGVWTFLAAGSATVTSTNSLFAANTRDGAAENCFVNASGGAIVSGGGNLADDATCAFAGNQDQNDTEAGLDAELADNGGPTPTHALLDGSAAIDAGVGTALTTDQRGVARDELPDIGAFEVGGE